MWYALIIWTAVVPGTSYASHTLKPHYDWRPLMETKSLEGCHKAAAQLGYVGEKKDGYRCIGKE